MNTRRILLASVALLILALLVSPALATPPLHRATYSGYGVTGDRAGDVITNDIIGDNIRFAGMVIQNADGSWKGHGVFESETSGLTANLVVTDGTDDDGSGREGVNILLLKGIADVSINDIPVGTTTFDLILETYYDNGKVETYDLFLDDETGGHYWWISAIGGISGGGLRVS